MSDSTPAISLADIQRRYGVSAFVALKIQADLAALRADRAQPTALDEIQRLNAENAVLKRQLDEYDATAHMDPLAGEYPGE